MTGLRLGVDVGGTHTDAVVLRGPSVLATHKALTSDDIGAGICDAVAAVLRAADAPLAEVQAVMIGTTQFTNAVVERRDLTPTAAVRVGLPATASVPPRTGWPTDLAAAIGDHGFMVHGGHHYTGAPLSEVEPGEIRALARTLAERGVGHVAVTAVYAPVNAASEQHVKALLLEAAPELDVTLSSELGRVGLLERENATVLNASLRPLAKRVITSFADALVELGLSVPCFVSQNDGTLMSAEYAMRYPVLTFSSGPTNSMRGAAFLSGAGSAVVVDVGGTTADIGMLIDGFPRESSLAVEIGGVLTSFRMPDVLALGIGGGTIVDADTLSVGPRSVGHRLVRMGRVFGGDTLTLTDVAVAAGRARIGDASAVAGLAPEQVRRVMDTVAERLAAGIDRIKTSSAPVPVLAVGGGEFLVPDRLPGVSEVLRPRHAAVANAIGAALAQVSGEVELIYSRASRTREAALEAAFGEATARAVAAGARPETVTIADVEEVALAYMAEGTDRLRVKAVGDLEVGG